MKRSLLLVVIVLAACVPLRAADDEPVKIVFDPTAEYQVIEGFGAAIPWIPIWSKTKPEVPPQGFFGVTYRNLKGRKDPLPSSFMEHILDAAVYELGLTRLRLEVGPYMEKEKDNDDPNEVNLDAFCFSWLDSCVEEIVLPIEKRLK